MSDGPLNPETLEILKQTGAESGPDFLAEIVKMYTEDTESRFVQAWQALRAGEAALFAGIVHAIKGSSLNMGADELAAMMQSMEREAKRGTLPPEDRVRAGEAEFVRVKAALAEHFG